MEEEELLDDLAIDKTSSQTKLHPLFWIFLLAWVGRAFYEILSFQYLTLSSNLGLVSDITFILAGLIAYKKRVFHIEEHHAIMDKYFVLFFIGVGFHVGQLLFYGVAPWLFIKLLGWADIAFRIAITVIPVHYYKTIHKESTPWLFRIPMTGAIFCWFIGIFLKWQIQGYAAEIMLLGGVLFGLSFVALYISHRK